MGHNDRLREDFILAVDYQFENHSDDLGMTVSTVSLDTRLMPSLGLPEGSIQRPLYHFQDTKNLVKGMFLHAKIAKQLGAKKDQDHVTAGFVCLHEPPHTLQALCGMGPNASAQGMQFAVEAAEQMNLPLSIVGLSIPEMPDRTKAKDCGHLQDKIRKKTMIASASLTALTNQLKPNATSASVAWCNTFGHYSDAVQTPQFFPLHKTTIQCVNNRNESDPIVSLATYGTNYEFRLYNQLNGFFCPSESDQSILMDAIYGSQGQEGGIKKSGFLTETQKKNIIDMLLNMKICKAQGTTVYYNPQGPKIGAFCTEVIDILQAVQDRIEDGDKLFDRVIEPMKETSTAVVDYFSKL